ncbi:MAG TPA: hypothetical protein VGA56_07100 [Opitutaceae bacterium]
MSPSAQLAHGRRRRHPVRIALRLGLGAMLFSACAGPRVEPVSAAGNAESLRYSRLARTAFETGSLARAETLYTQALMQARARDDAAGIGNAAYNLAALLITREDRAAAWPLLDEAEAELARAGEPLADVWLVKARLAAADGRISDALRWADLVVSQPEAGATATHRVEVALLRGGLACDEKDAARARSELVLAREQLPPGNLPLAAGAEKLAGRLLLVEGRYAEAAAVFDREVDLCRQAGQPRAMVHALVRAAESYARAGDTRAAAQRTYRASRSALAQGDLTWSQRLIAQSRTLAEKQGDSEFLSRVAFLETEIERADRDARSP